MFMGEFNHTIDIKSRAIIPAKFREELGDNFVLTAGLDGCLYIYPQKEWISFAKSLMELPFNKEAREFQRYFMQNAAECETDKQGRFLIPNKLKDFAGIDKDIVFIGVISKIEVWDSERLGKGNGDKDMDEIAERMSTEFGLKF